MLLQQAAPVASDWLGCRTIITAIAPHERIELDIAVAYCEVCGFIGDDFCDQIGRKIVTKYNTVGLRLRALVDSYMDNF